MTFPLRQGAVPPDLTDIVSSSEPPFENGLSSPYVRPPTPLPPPPPSPHSTPNKLPFRGSAFLGNDYGVHFSCGHVDVSMAGRGTRNETIAGCIGKCCLTVVAETVADVLLNQFKLEFQEMIHCAIRHELLRLYRNDTFNRFFHRCAAEEISRHFEAAKARFSAMDREFSPSHYVVPPVPASLLAPRPNPETHRSTFTPRRASSSPGDKIETIRVRKVDNDRVALGIIPVDGIINRDLDATMRDLVDRLPTRRVPLTENIEVTYYMPHAGSDGPFYWVPYGYAIGVFSEPDHFYTLWAGSNGAEGYRVDTINEGCKCLERALLEGRFGLLR
ncbi:hypothetical protein CONPUDRAFT_155094 [Coniophora puteana RWD-64-598 SS2]|uniref:Uncharacterized protein n=1 Tax=Coniophora puteana (strain RWD-64-598) TaxID=741705 RepID=A0A5M3MKE2_CONPW|nr:uncharacterized protein CONPUDRAFT_155094 [Coniophora puteana RWD-64-598 SS2]EIW79699.1 hypothetical protein CONPUDRAFT_155094 [Coniophora puteana RWD-64-598 SS2]